MIVVARTDPKASKAAHGISLIMVDSNTPGYSKGRKLKKMGLKAQDTSELFFENVRVPVGNRLGDENKGFYYLMNELPQERLTIAGLASKCVCMCVCCVVCVCVCVVCVCVCVCVCVWKGREEGWEEEEGGKGEEEEEAVKEERKMMMIMMMMIMIMMMMIMMMMMMMMMMIMMMMMMTKTRTRRTRRTRRRRRRRKTSPRRKGKKHWKARLFQFSQHPTSLSSCTR